MVKGGAEGSHEVVDFLMNAGISENAILVEDASPCYIYVIARVPVSLLYPLHKHPHVLILTLGPTESYDVNLHTGSLSNGWIVCQGRRGDRVSSQF